MAKRNYVLQGPTSDEYIHKGKLISHYQTTKKQQLLHHRIRINH